MQIHNANALFIFLKYVHNANALFIFLKHTQVTMYICTYATHYKDVKPRTPAGFEPTIFKTFLFLSVKIFLANTIAFCWVRYNFFS
jgi:hypothetical protein